MPASDAPCERATRARSYRYPLHRASTYSPCVNCKSLEVLVWSISQLVVCVYASYVRSCLCSRIEQCVRAKVLLVCFWMNDAYAICNVQYAMHYKLLSGWEFFFIRTHGSSRLNSEITCLHRTGHGFCTTFRDSDKKKCIWLHWKVVVIFARKLVG